jgi:hypothetical protein
MKNNYHCVDKQNQFMIVKVELNNMIFLSDNNKATDTWPSLVKYHLGSGVQLGIFVLKKLSNFKFFVK